MRELYRLLWLALYYAGRRRSFWIGAGLIAVSYATAGESVLGALPYVVMWALIAGAARFVLAALPAPSAAALPRNKEPPEAQLAVSVTERCAPGSCPDLYTMAGRLPDPLRRLLQGGTAKG